MAAPSGDTYVTETPESNYTYSDYDYNDYDYDDSLVYEDESEDIDKDFDYNYNYIFNNDDDLNFICISDYCNCLNDRSICDHVYTPEEELHRLLNMRNMQRFVFDNEYTYIYNVYDLNSIRYDLDGNFRLMSDIDLSGTNWQPIGTTANPFIGTFDGNGFSISNLNISLLGQNNIGMFGINSGSITNVIIENANVTGHDDTGVLAGQNLGVIMNATVQNSGEVIGNTRVGGLVGANRGFISDSSAVNISTVTARATNAGGFAGLNSGTITNSSTTGVGDLVAENGHAGGFVGSNGSNTIRLSYSTNNARSLRRPSTTSDAGGFVGVMSIGLIEQSYATGNVYGASAVGGFVGRLSTSATIRNSFATGNASNSLPANSNAGFIGVSSGSPTIENNYSLSPNPRGFGSALTITNSFFEISRPNENANPQLGRTRHQMLQQATYINWDFNTIWEMTSGEYPTLRGLSKPNSNFTYIYSASDLNNIRNNLGGNFILASDIDLSGFHWNPIGTTANPFFGTLDGNGFTIRNLNINLPDRDNVGLFGVNFGLITDVTLENVDITGRDDTGAIVGQNFSVIMNTVVNNSGEITGRNRVGGLVGTNMEVITDSSTMNISALTARESSAGGFVGVNRGTITHSSTTGFGDLVAENGHAGGFAGQNSGGTIRLSYSTNNVRSLRRPSTTADAGGFVGVMSVGLIEQSYATGNVYGASTGGGFVGRVSGSSSIRNSYATGHASNSLPANASAGFLGHSIGNLVIENNYSISPSPNGFGNANTITNSFFEIARSNENLNSQLGRTRHELFQQATYTNWDFDTIWEMTDGDYPILRGISRPCSNFINIYNASDLNNIRHNLGGSFRLMSDINLSGLNWQPIGTTATPFFGVLEGNGFTISNLNINLNDRDGVGLFGASFGLITDVTVENARVIGRDDTGILVGLNSGVIMHTTVQNSGNIIGRNRVGGLIGTNMEVITDSSAMNISALTATASNAGGFVGLNRGTISNSSTTGVGELFAENGHAGGFVGQNDNAIIRLSYSTNNVRNLRRPSITADAGGFVGSMVNWSTIEQSFATGNVEGASTGGGFAGRISHASIIRNSFATGDATANASAGFVAAGVSPPTIENSYTLSPNPRGFSASQGVLNGTVNSFFELDRLAEPIESPLARTREQMLRRSTYIGWNFDTIWSMTDGRYPELRGIGPQEQNNPERPSNPPNPTNPAILPWPTGSKEVTLWFDQLDHLSDVRSDGLNVQSAVGAEVFSPVHGVISNIANGRVYIDFNHDGTPAQVVLGNIAPTGGLRTGSRVRVGDAVGFILEHGGRGVLEIELRQGNVLVNPAVHFDLSGMSEGFLGSPFANFFERNANNSTTDFTAYDVRFAENLDLDEGEVYLRRLVETIFYSYNLAEQGYTMDDVLIWCDETRTATVNIFGEAILFVPEDMYEKMQEMAAFGMSSRSDDENDIIISYRLENSRAIVNSMIHTDEFARFRVNMGYKYSARIHLHPISRNRYIHTFGGFISLARYVQRDRYVLVGTDREANNIIHTYNRNTRVTLAHLDAFGFYMGENAWYRNRGLLALDDVLTRYEINTDLRIAFFMGNVHHESFGGNSLLEEFNRTPTITEADVAAHFNNMYNGRMGNRIGSNDGSRFRGAGYIQLTGRNNYTRFARYIGSICALCDAGIFHDSIVDYCIVCRGFELIGGTYNRPVNETRAYRPEYIDIGPYIWKASGHFWGEHYRGSTNIPADARDYREILDRINSHDGATLGIRNRLTNRFYRILTGRSLGLPE